MTPLESLARRNPALAAVLDRWAEVALPDAWLVAGCVAQTVWNLAAGRKPLAGIADLDIIYHDPSDLSEAAEAAHAARLGAAFAGAGLPLDVKNQARVHQWYPARFGRAIAPHRDSAAAIGTFPATATALGLRPGAVCAPFGLADLLAGRVRANRRLASPAVFAAKAARWKAEWPWLEVLPWEHGVD